MENVNELLRRLIGPIIFIIAISGFMVLKNSVDSIVVSTKSAYQDERTFSQGATEDSVEQQVSSGHVIGFVISEPKCSIIVRSRIDGGWYTTTINYVSESVYSVRVTNQSGGLEYEQVLTTLELFPADSFVTKGMYSKECELTTGGEVATIEYVMVSDREVYSE